MYYWHAVFWVGKLKYEHNFWADSYDEAKDKICLMYGSGVLIEKIERVNNA